MRDLGRTLARLAFVDPGAIVCVGFAVDEIEPGSRGRIGPFLLFVISMTHIDTRHRPGPPRSRTARLRHDPDPA